MSRANIFAAVAGIIGLIADVITIFGAMNGSPPAPERHTVITPAVIFSFIYGWFIVSWVLVGLKYSRYGDELLEVTALVVFTTGLLMFPILVYANYLHPLTEPTHGYELFEALMSTALKEGGIGIGIVLAIMVVMSFLD